MTNNSALTAIASVYYQQKGESARGVSLRFSQFLETDEQLYHRTLKPSQEWKRLDSGWIKKCSMLVIEARGTSPVKVSIGETPGDNVFEITPKRFMILPGPESLERVWLCSGLDSAECEVYLFPG